MMDHQQAAGTSHNPYLQNMVLSASPAQLVAMLFDGFVRFLNAARDGFDEPDPQAKVEAIHNNLIRCQSILTELQSSLDFERGGEIARQLNDLYVYFSECLRQVNVKKDVETLSRLIPLVEELRDAWHQIALPGVPQQPSAGQDALVTSTR
jgi:flagellar secretion chaperone FliS